MSLVEYSEDSMALDPFPRELLQRMRTSGWLGLAAVTPQEGRAFLAAGRTGLGCGPDMAEVTDLQVPTRAGTVAARLFLPKHARSGLVVYVHGGGWVLGALDDFDGLGRALAAGSGRAILMPEYRLAPEHPFPAALQDCEDTLMWVASQTEATLAVVGDSAGANLVIASLSRLRSRILPVLQVLLYPVTDCDFTTRSYREESDGMALTLADMQWFFDHYAPADVRTGSLVSPLRSDDLTGSPPTLIVTAGHDVLRDEGDAYADRLRLAGVPVTHYRYDGAIHGFMRLYNHYPAAREAVARVVTALSDALDHAGGQLPGSTS